MLVRLWLLICLLGLALPSALVAADARQPGDGAAVGAAVGAAPAPPIDAIEADEGPLSRDLRSSEQVEPLAGLERILLDGPSAELPAERHATPGPSAHRAAGWCDVVQCRRLAGAHLLRYATAPPARR